MRALRRARSGATVIALRYHNVYGPRMPRDTPYAGVASIFASSLAAGDAPRVFEDGGQLRDFVHVRDVARANVAALTADAARAGAFNVASGSRAPILEMAQALADAHGPAAPRADGDRRLPARRRAPRVRLGRSAPTRARVHARARTSPPAWPSSPTPRCGRRGRERATLLVIAKDPQPGPHQDTPVPAVRAPSRRPRLAAAALRDTLDVVVAHPRGAARARARRRPGALAPAGSQ